MAAIDQPVGHALIVREAAAACRLSPRTIRRKLNAGAFPNAFKAPAPDDPDQTIWKIPVTDLEHGPPADARAPGVLAGTRRHRTRPFRSHGARARALRPVRSTACRARGGRRGRRARVATGRGR